MPPVFCACGCCCCCCRHCPEPQLNPACSECTGPVASQPALLVVAAQPKGSTVTLLTQWQHHSHLSINGHPKPLASNSSSWHCADHGAAGGAMCAAVAMRCCVTSLRRCQSQGTGLDCITANANTFGCCNGGGAVRCDAHGCDRAWRHALIISFSIGSDLTHPHVSAAASKIGHNSSAGSKSVIKTKKCAVAEAVFIVL